MPFKETQHGLATYAYVVWFAHNRLNLETPANRETSTEDMPLFRFVSGYFLSYNLSMSDSSITRLDGCNVAESHE
jgi:hypothetical protein